MRPRAGEGDLVDVHHALGHLDLGLDADAANLEPPVHLDLGQEHVEHIHVVGLVGLGQHDGVQVPARALDDLDHVAVEPLGVDAVDADAGDLAGPVEVLEGLDDHLPGLDLLVGGDAVLEVEEDVVGVALAAALEHAQVGSGTSELNAAKFHLVSLLRDFGEYPASGRA